MRIKLVKMALLAVTGLSVVGCGDNGNLPILSSGNATLNVLLTDKPFPFSEVERVDVFIVRIDAKSGAVGTEEAEDENELSGWHTIGTPNVLFNLLNLTNGKTAALGSAVLPAGTYRSFRLVLHTDKSSVTLNDGTHPDVKWPAAGTSGIKLILDEPIVANGTTNVLIDFDIGRSFVMRGNSISQNGLLFKPVIHAVSEQSTGSVEGSVRADNTGGAGIPNATVEVLKNGTTLTDTNDNNIVRTGMTDGSGNFKLAFIPPGTYVVRATPPDASGYKPALLTGGVVITAATAVTGKIIVVTK